METSLKDILIDVAGVVLESALEVAVMLVLAWSAQVLWNGSAAEVFNLPHITYTQALYLIALKEILSTPIFFKNKK